VTVAGTGEGVWGRRARLGLGGLLVVTGALHFVVPGPYVKIIPALLPGGWARPLVYVSGAAELAGGAGLLLAPTSAMGWFVAALLVAVFPANVQMALDSPNAVTVLRLPLQIPLVWAAVGVARARPVPSPRP
jgi:uncharacterized membrane protein